MEHPGAGVHAGQSMSHSPNEPPRPHPSRSHLFSQRDPHRDVPRASHTQPVPTELISSPRLSLLSANSTQAKRPLVALGDLGVIVNPGPCLPPSHLISRVLALLSLIWSPLPRPPPAPVWSPGVWSTVAASSRPPRTAAPPPLRPKWSWKNPDSTWLRPFLRRELEPGSLRFST